MAEAYRNAEMPFKLYDVPNINQVRQKWTSSYLAHRLRFHVANVERSESNHFMYFSTSKRGTPKGYKPPQDTTFLTYPQFHHIAKDADKHRLPHNATHYYFTLNSAPKNAQLTARLTSAEFVSADLPIFSTPTDNFFIPNVRRHKGIQCRFGMRGVVAAAHYDSGRNMVAMLKGQKRYILSPPRACKHLAIIADEHHPSYRHSVLDWSNLSALSFTATTTTTTATDSEGGPSGAGGTVGLIKRTGKAPHPFTNAASIDTIVRAGEVLYIPSFWFHFIVSLDMSIQCNSRSGYPEDMQGSREIFHKDCMHSKTGISGNLHITY